MDSSLNKASFIAEYFPTAKAIEFVKLNLDDIDLSFADILRNVNHTIPKNTKLRMEIESGITVIGILCRSEFLHPYHGVLLLVANQGASANIVSSNYIVLTVSEDRIISETRIDNLIGDITNHLVRHYHGIISNFPEFYKRYIYNEHELYDDKDE